MGGLGPHLGRMARSSHPGAWICQGCESRDRVNPGHMALALTQRKDMAIAGLCQVIPL